MKSLMKVSQPQKISANLESPQGLGLPMTWAAIRGLVCLFVCLFAGTVCSSPASTMSCSGPFCPVWNDKTRVCQPWWYEQSSLLQPTEDAAESSWPVSSFCVWLAGGLWAPRRRWLAHGKMKVQNSASDWGQVRACCVQWKECGPCCLRFRTKTSASDAGAECISNYFTEHPSHCLPPTTSLFKSHVRSIIQADH